MPVDRPNFNDNLQLSVTLAREALRKSSDALRLPVPDTFVGRKTQEPFPQQHEDSSIEGWLTSKELRPPN